MIFIILYITLTKKQQFHARLQQAGMGGGRGGRGRGGGGGRGRGRGGRGRGGGGGGGRRGPSLEYLEEMLEQGFITEDEVYFCC